jgi:hypothetical protein
MNVSIRLSKALSSNLRRISGPIPIRAFHSSSRLLASYSPQTTETKAEKLSKAQGFTEYVPVYENSKNLMRKLTGGFFAMQMVFWSINGLYIFSTSDELSLLVPAAGLLTSVVLGVLVRRYNNRIVRRVRPVLC